MLRCRECDGEELSWQSMTVPDWGMLNGLAARTVFFLGCDECSETVVHSVSVETVAEALNNYGWRPGDAH